MEECCCCRTGDELVRQPEKYFDCSFGIEKAEEHAGDEEVVSASVQSLSRPDRMKRFAPDAFDTIIIDEGAPQCSQKLPCGSGLLFRGKKAYRLHRHSAARG